VAQSESGEVALGFFEGETHRLVPIDECLILSPRLNKVLGQLRQPQWLDRLRGCREIELLANDQDDQIRITLSGDFEAGEPEPLAGDLLRQVNGTVAVAFRDGQRLQVFGDSVLTYRVGEFRYQLSAGAFFQSSRYLLSEFVNTVTETEPGDLALDLYSGAGLFTLPLARRFRQVIAVECHPAAARDLEANAENNGLKHIRAVGQSALDFLRRFAQSGPDFVILDPPRCGVGKPALKYLVDLRPRRVHYVACHPPTWARDLAYILERHYRLEEVEMFDCFPQTYHIECLARLVR
jgi:23S rRNA (uracil1939-C5)-methyltransferase